MLTEAEIAEFYILSQRRAARRFLAEPETNTGFDLPLDFATKHGREVLVQQPDFTEQST